MHNQHGQQQQNQNLGHQAGGGMVFCFLFRLFFFGNGTKKKRIETEFNKIFIYPA